MIKEFFSLIEDLEDGNENLKEEFLRVVQYFSHSETSYEAMLLRSIAKPL